MQIYQELLYDKVLNLPLDTGKNKNNNFDIYSKNDRQNRID